MIGVGMMALFSVILASVRTTAQAQIVGHYPIDYIMTALRTESEGATGTIPVSYVDKVRSRAEFSGVVVTRVVRLDVDGTPGRVGAIDTRTLSTLDVPRIAPGTAILTGQREGLLGRQVKVGGLSVTVTSTQIVALPGTARPDLLLSWDDLNRIAGPGDVTTVMVKARDGITATQSRDLVDALTEEYPLIEVNSLADISDDFESAVNGLIALFAGLLGTAVLIALFGIANTLSLSVVERTRESATLRAIGLTRGQLRATLVIEAVVMGVVGTLVGITFGLIYGRLVIAKALSAVHPTVVVPWTWIAGLVGLAALASVLAALLPARRAAQASIVAAMADT
jgi:putative ABC transport system permease protein